MSMVTNLTPYVVQGIRVCVPLGSYLNAEEHVKKAILSLHPDELRLASVLSDQGVRLLLYPYRKGSSVTGLFSVKGTKPVVSLYVSPVTGKLCKGTLIHEAVHYRQWLRGELVIDGKDYYYKGQPIVFSNASDYFSHPLEKEAHREECNWLYRVKATPFPSSIQLLGRHLNYWLAGLLSTS